MRECESNALAFLLIEPGTPADVIRGGALRGAGQGPSLAVENRGYDITKSASADSPPPLWSASADHVREGAFALVRLMKTTGVRHTITLDYLERRPEPPSVVLRGQVALLAITAARNYGLACGARRMRLRHPDRRLVGYYRALGFGVVWKGAQPVYCEQEI